MTRLVMKFGGKALANTASMHRTAMHILREYHAGKQVIVVTSAMAGTTDRLIDALNAWSTHPNAREYDMVVSSGEQVAAGMLAMLLHTHSVPACSWMGWQIPITTTPQHACADIIHIDTTKLENLLDAGTIPIITGFQGVSAQGDMTTLGRGGSDLTAVALASYLRADWCDLYKDVGGIYTANPHLVPNAHRLDYIDYSNLLKIAHLGARILAPKAVEWASKHHTPLRIFSFLDDASQGTCITADISPSPLHMIISPDWLNAKAKTCTLYCVGMPESAPLDHLPVNVVAQTGDLIELCVEGPHLKTVVQALHAYLDSVLKSTRGTKSTFA